MESCYGNQDDVMSTSGNQPVLYRPLETPQTIRLLRSRPRGADGVLVLEMFHFPLLDDASCPRFTAISYVWGDKKLHPSKLVINGRTCRVLESIYPILTRLGHHPTLREESWFWIDYLCINQADVLERGSQVALMGSLYTRASRTVVWLGEEEGTSTPRGAKDATALMHHIVDEWPWQAGTDEEEVTRLRDSVSSDQWQALRSWMKRPWWTRVWTLQEFLLPERLIFLCGDEAIERDTWYNAIITISNYSAVGRVGHAAFTNQWTRRRLVEWRELSSSAGRRRHGAGADLGMGLVAMMAYIGFYEATDDRDRLYALLGVCTDLDRAIVGTPSYDLPVEEVYMRLAVNFIRQHRSLDIVCFRGILATEQEQLPSWVPDWRCWNSRSSRPIPSMVSEPSRQHIGNFRSLDWHHGQVDQTLIYAASAGLPAEYIFSRGNTRLTCRGFIIDTIDGLGPVYQQASDANSSASSSYASLVPSTSDLNTRHRANPVAPGRSIAILESLVRSLSLDRAGRYLMYRANVRGYVQQLLYTALAGPAALHARQHALQEWYLANESLCVRGASISEHLSAVIPLLQCTDAFERCDLWRAADMTVGERSWDCRLVVTEQSHMAMAPRLARKGDVVAVLIGCSVPLILRMLEGKEEYIVVGECFIPGFMDGEVINSGRDLRDIILL